MTSAASRSWLPAGAALVTVLLWASAFVAIRRVGSQFSPGPLALGRLLVGSAVLGAVLAGRPRRRPTRGQWRRLLVCGVLWFGVYNVALNAAERRIDAGTASMLVNVGPLLIAVLAGLLLDEGFPRRLLAGSAVAFAGVLLIGAGTSTGARADGSGVLLCLLAAVAYSVAVVTQKPLLAELPALQVTWLACAVGTVACLPFAPALVTEAGRASSGAIGWVVYLRRLPHSGRLHDLGLRPGPLERRTTGRHHLPRAPRRGPPRLAVPGRGPGGPGVRRWSALPGRRRAVAARPRAGQGGRVVRGELSPAPGPPRRRVPAVAPVEGQDRPRGTGSSG